MGKHTKTPWYFDQDMSNSFEIYSEKEGRCVAVNNSEEPFRLADAKFIVKAVNNHEALVEALKDLVDYLGDDWSREQYVIKAKEVLLKASK